eukprot:3121839-Lingulodinium_polyedra.AAC.1
MRAGARLAPQPSARPVLRGREFHGHNQQGVEGVHVWTIPARCAEGGVLRSVWLGCCFVWRGMQTRRGGS